MANVRSIRSYHLENGLYLLMYRSFRRIWILTNSAMLARSFALRKLTIEPPFRLNGRRFISIGENFSAGPGLWLDAITRYDQRSYHPRIVIGTNVSISENVHIAATNYVEIGSDVLVGSKVLITDHNHGIYRGEHPCSPDEAPSNRALDDGRRTVVGNRVWLGDGVVVAPGATIGDGAVIGANSVVVGTIPANSIAAGAPARVIKHYDSQSRQWQRENA